MTSVQILILGGVYAGGLAAGFFVRRWWVALVPYALVAAAVGLAAIGSSDGELSHRDSVIFTAILLGLAATPATVLALAGVIAGRVWGRARSS